MRRLLPTLTLLFVVAITTTPAPAAAATRHRGHASACAARQPVRLRFTRSDGRTVGTLSWKAGARAGRGTDYRVLRNGVVVGQTLGHSMRVAVSLGKHYKLRVEVVSDDRPLACAGSLLRAATTSRGPSVPGFVTAKADSASTVTVSWQPSVRGDAPLVGYRVLRDGAVYAQTKSHSMVVRVASDRTYTFTVVAVDRDGVLSGASAPVRVQINHEAPGSPSGLAADAVNSTTVTLSWQPSQTVEGRIAGYRVLRSGVPVGQFPGTSVQLSNLTPSTTYAYSVEAVDSLGYVSGATPAVSVRTAPPGAPSAPGSLLGAALNDSTVQLSWQPSTPAQGKIAGYRVLRNGVSVGQYDSTSVTIGNLAASTSYTFTVVAVDSLGDQSDTSSQVTVTTANPTPTTGHVTAFLLADTDESFADFQNHYMEIGTVSPTYYDCNNTTQLSGVNVPLITNWAQARDVQVLPRFDCQNTNVLDEMLNNPSMSQQWINYIVGQVTTNNYNGANLDLEAGPAADRNQYTAFVTQLAAALHAAGKLLVVDVSAKTADVQNNPRSTFFDYNALSAQADDLLVMAWGIHWATSAPGAQDDMTWVSQVVNYISTLPRVNKYILGMQLYAMDWPDGGGAAHPATSYEYAQAMALAASLGITPTYDPTSDAYTFSYTDASGTPHVVWFTNAQTEGDRITLAHNAGFGGVGVWRLGEEDQSLWSNPLLTGTW